MGIIGLAARSVVRLDLAFECFPFDKPHHIVMLSVVPRSLGVDRHDAGVFQTSGHFGFLQETLASLFVVAPLRSNLLDRDFASELMIERDQHFAQSALLVRAQDLESVTIPIHRSLVANRDWPVARSPRSCWRITSGWQTGPTLGILCLVPPHRQTANPPTSA